MKPWTPDESRLLRLLGTTTGWLIANPDAAIEHWRDSSASGGHFGVHWEFARTAINARWYTQERFVSCGQTLIRPGRFLHQTRVTYTRLQRWAESLPDDIRRQASTHWRTYPVNTRDLGALHALVLELIPDPGPPATPDQRKPVRDLALPAMPPAEPADLLELLEMTA